MSGLLVAGCATARAAPRVSHGRPKQPPPPGNAAPAPGRELTETTTVLDCRFTAARAMYWRDMMPGMSRRPPPLITLVRVRVENRSDRSRRFRPSGVVRAEDGTEHRITFEEIRVAGQDWDGMIAPAQTLEVQLVSRDGPALRVGTSVRALITWRTRGGAGTMLAGPGSIAGPS